MISSELPEVLGMSDRVLVMTAAGWPANSPRRGHPGEDNGPRDLRRPCYAERRMSVQAVTDEPSLISRVLAARELPTLAAIAMLALVIAIGNPSFLSLYNMQLLGKEVGVLGIMAIGEMIVIITGGIDLSAGAVVALTSVLAAMGLQAGVPVGLVALGIVFVCVLIGLAHSFFINVVGLAPFIITLGSMSIWRGVVLVLTTGYPVKITHPGFLLLGQGNLLGVPLQFILMLVVSVIAGVALIATPFGREAFTPSAITPWRRASQACGCRAWSPSPTSRPPCCSGSAG